ncbi:MAG: SET domain-containing protein-lysine N-methyltransferase [Patescibacteria group bacterium]
MFLISQDFYQIRKTKKKGLGVFAQKEIPAGTLIGDYIGRIIKDEEIDALEKVHNNSCYSMDYNDNGLSIFPVDVKAPGVHLFNHSCAPNCDTYFYYGHTLFFSLRKIWPGEELTIDYSFDPDAPDGLLHACFCGSSNCRGTMYTSDERLLRFGAFCRAQTRGQKFTAQKPGTILQALSHYPKSIKDFPNFNLFANLTIKPLVLEDEKVPSLSALRRQLRSSGRVLKFKRLGLSIWGIADGKVLAQK